MSSADAVIHQHTLSNAQLEIIKLYSTNLNEHELLELKNILVPHFSQKAISEAEKKGLSAQTMDELLKECNDKR